jgi:hypothetical protein
VGGIASVGAAMAALDAWRVCIKEWVEVQSKYKIKKMRVTKNDTSDLNRERTQPRSRFITPAARCFG